MEWLKYKKLYFSISAILIAVSIFGLTSWGLKLAVDFQGGSIIEYKIDEESTKDKLTEKLTKQNLEVSSVTTTATDTYLFKLPTISEDDKEIIASATAEIEGSIEELRFETVGPSIGPELVKKTIMAIAVATGAILVWVAYQFKNIKYGTSAILAMLHDSFILVGSFSLFGRLYGAEVDFLFVTALLTTLSFSVHDTIVVFDRIREIGDKSGEVSDDVANRALTETMVRSLNNSFTIIFMLAALLLLGGTTIKWFAAALLIGTILGTYSSPFVAVPLLVSWDSVVEKLKTIKFPKRK